MKRNNVNLLRSYTMYLNNRLNWLINFQFLIVFGVSVCARIQPIKSVDTHIPLFCWLRLN